MYSAKPCMSTSVSARCTYLGTACPCPWPTCRMKIKVQ